MTSDNSETDNVSDAFQQRLDELRQLSNSDDPQEHREQLVRCVLRDITMCLENPDEPLVEQVQLVARRIAEHLYYWGYPRPPLKLDDDQLHLLLQALVALPAWLEDGARSRKALEAFWAAPKPKRWEAYARAIGFSPTQRQLNRKYDDGMLLLCYRHALSAGLPGGKLQLGLIDRSVDLTSDPPRKPIEALKAVAKLFNFPSEEACRKHLLRLRAEKGIHHSEMPIPVVD